MLRRLALIAPLLLVGLLIASTESATELVPRSQVLNFNIGCQQDDPNNPACSSTDYWLGRDVGQSSVGNANTITPLNWVSYQTGGYATQDFMGNDTLDDTYLLRSDEPIAGEITIVGFIGGGEVAVDSGVYVEINALPVEGFVPIPIGSAEVTKLVVVPGENVYEFEIDVPEQLDGVEVGNLIAEVGMRHITAVEYGFLNGEGGSWFTLPYYEEVTSESADGS